MSDTDRIIFISTEGLRLQFNFKALTKLSEYFRGMFNGLFKESEQKEIMLEGVSQRTFSLIHEWVHGVRTEFIDLNLHDLLELFVFVDRFLFVGVKKQIYHIIGMSLNQMPEESDMVYEVLQTSDLMGDLVLKDMFFKWFEKTLVPPIVWKRDIIITFTERLFSHRKCVENTELTNEALQDILLYLEESHEKLMALYRNYIENQLLWNSPTERIWQMYRYLLSLLNIRRGEQVEKNDEISVKEHKLLHEYLFFFRHDFKDQTFAMKLRLMTIAKRFDVVKLSGQLMQTISDLIFDQYEPSATFYSIVETYLETGDPDLENIFSLWALTQFKGWPGMNMQQMLQYTSKLFSWQYDIEVNKFDLTEQTIEEINRVFKENSVWLTSNYEILMDKSDLSDLEESINQMKQLEEELKDKNQQEFKKFVTKTREEYEKKLMPII